MEAPFESSFGTRLFEVAVTMSAVGLLVAFGFGATTCTINDREQEAACMAAGGELDAVESRCLAGDGFVAVENWRK